MHMRSECQFALLSMISAGADQGLLVYIDAAIAFGLHVSLDRTKLLVVGRKVQDEEKAPALVADGEMSVWMSSPTISRVHHCL